MFTDHIAVEGLIGAGKTTLARRLAERWNARTVLEEFEENPFLPRFYAEPDRYAFSVELSFLAQRYHQLKRATERELFRPGIVSDYSIGKSLVFAGVTLGPEEFALFSELYHIMYAGLPRPQVILYLHLPLERLRERIGQRGRDYESAIQTTYLERLHERYMDHLRKLEGVCVLVADLGAVDLLHDREAFEGLCDQLEGAYAPGHRVLKLASTAAR